MQVFVQDVMTHMTHRFSEELTIGEAALALMDRHDTMLFFADEQGHLQGVLTDYDVIKARLSGIDSCEAVGSMLSHPTTVIEADQHLGEVLGLFREAHCQRVPVVSRGVLVGELDRVSVLRLMLTLEDIGESLETSDEFESLAEESNIPAPQYLQNRNRVSSDVPTKDHGGF